MPQPTDGTPRSRRMAAALRRTSPDSRRVGRGRCTGPGGVGRVEDDLARDGRGPRETRDLVHRLRSPSGDDGRDRASPWARRRRRNVLNPTEGGAGATAATDAPRGWRRSSQGRRHPARPDTPSVGTGGSVALISSQNRASRWRRRPASWPSPRPAPTPPPADVKGQSIGVWRGVELPRRGPQDRPVGHHRPRHRHTGCRRDELQRTRPRSPQATSRRSGAGWRPARPDRGAETISSSGQRP